MSRGRLTRLVIKLLRSSREIILAGALIAGATLIAFLLIVSRKEPERTQPKEPVTPVRTFVARQASEQLRLRVYGTVQEHRRLSLGPEVGGRVVEQSEKLFVGGLFEEGELLLRVDPRDYETVIEQEEAAVARAEFDLKQERGRQIVARREWELLDPELTSTELGRELALREPQVAEKQAALEAAQGRLEKARLDLARTELRAPFAAQVLEESVELGQIVNPATPIVSLVGTSEFRVQLSVPVSRLPWLKLPTDSEPGARVWVIQDLGDKQQVEREGRIVRLLADLEPQGRMARVLVSVKDPLGLHSEQLRASPLLLGAYVRAIVEGPIVENVFRIPRSALREGGELWVRKADDSLELRHVRPLFSYENEILLSEGLEDGDEVILSSIPLPVPGMKLTVTERIDPKEAP